MPVLFLDRLPLPSLKAYTSLSLLLLSCSLYYAVQVTTQSGYKRNDTEETSTIAASRGYDGGGGDNIVFVDDHVPSNNVTIRKISLTDIIYYMIEEPLCIWTLINMAYCCLILIGKVIQKIVFGELRVSEQQHVKDKFWNFVFYKFIFIFGVMNVQFMDEVVLWCSWFSVLGFLHLLAQLCKDRFEYLSFSPTMPKWTHVRLLSLLTGILATSLVLLVICILVGLHVGINTFAFMGAECVLLIVRTLFVIVRYAIHLWDVNHDGVWENRGTYVYYTELLFELCALFIDLLHHIHMLLWGNIFLSMASLVICMQIRYLFYEIQRRFKKHKNYLRVVRHMEQNYPMETTEELAANSDDCAICWDKMESARKLPCGHLFHNSCLQSWLEQDTSCPTCRTSLAGPTERSSEVQDNRDAHREHLMPSRLTGTPTAAAVHRNRTTTNHFFHFDGSRYVSWFPSFSVEVTHTQLLHRQAPVQTSQLDNMAWQVQQLFPQMPLNMIMDDLRITRSVDATVDNILEERLVAPPFQMQATRMAATPNPEASQELPAQSSSSGASTSENDSGDAAVAAQDENVLLEELGLMEEAQYGQRELADIDSESDERHMTSGGRFSKSPQERERMLADRKEELVKQAKKRYLSKMLQEGSRQQVIAGGHETDNDATSSAETRRFLAYKAARRRLKRNGWET